MSLKNELSLSCDGPRCKERIVAGLRYLDTNGEPVMEDSDDLIQAAKDYAWWNVTRENWDGGGTDAWFHDENCIKRYFREKATKDRQAELIEQGIAQNVIEGS